MENLEQIVEQSNEVENTQTEQEISLATISTIETDGVTITLDGSDSASEKHYKCNTGVKFSVGDRVKVTKESGSYIVEYPIGAPNSNLDVPESGTTGYFLAKTATGVEWATPSVSALSNGGYSVTLNSNVLFPSAATVSLGISTYPFNSAYIRGDLYLGKTTTKLGFFGTTPVARQTVASSATVATLITALKKYGLIL